MMNSVRTMLSLLILFCGLSLSTFAQTSATVKLVTQETIIGSSKENNGMFSSRFATSRDRRHVAYDAKRGEKWLVVVDGVEGKEYDSIADGSLVFIADGKRVAYGAKRGEKWLVVVDGVEGKEYDALVAALVFSADGKRVAYAARRGDKRFVVVDGVEGKEYDDFPMGDHLVFDGPNQFHFLARRGTDYLRVEGTIVDSAAQAK